MGRVWSHRPETIEHIRQKAIQQHAEGRGTASGFKTLDSIFKSALSKLGKKLSESHKREVSKARTGLTPTKEQVETFCRSQYNQQQGTNASKLTRYQAWEIRYKLIPAGVSINDIASYYGLHTKTISNIMIGKSWKLLKEDDYKK